MIAGPKVFDKELYNKEALREADDLIGAKMRQLGRLDFDSIFPHRDLLDGLSSPGISA